MASGTVWVTKDTYLDSFQPTTVQDANGQLVAGRNSAAPALYHLLLHFDLSAWQSILDADVGLYVSNATSLSTSARASRMTQTGWVEDQATWNEYATGLAWGVAGGDYTTTGEVTWDFLNTDGFGQKLITGVAALAQDAIDFRGKQLHLLLRIFNEASGTRQGTYYDRETPNTCVGGVNDGDLCSGAGDCPGGACTDVRPALIVNNGILVGGFAGPATYLETRDLFGGTPDYSDVARLAFGR